MRQHRLRLVVHGVRRRHYIDHTLFRKPFEEAIARASRRIFQIRFFAFCLSCDVGASNVQSHAKLFRQLRHELFVSRQKPSPAVCD